MEKIELIEEIKKLIVANKEDIIDINPAFLEYFQVEELVSIRDELLIKKSKIRENSFTFLDEIYEKTKQE